MLSQNARQPSTSNEIQTGIEQDKADVEALRAAYWAVVTASAHSVFSSHAIGNQQPVSEPILTAYQAAVAAFANSIFSHTEQSPGSHVNQLSSPTAQTIQRQMNTLMDIAPGHSLPTGATQSAGPGLTFRLPQDKTSQWVPEAVHRKEPVRGRRQLPKPIIRPSGEKDASAEKSKTAPQHQPGNQLRQTPNASVPSQPVSRPEMTTKVNNFLNQFQPALVAEPVRPGNTASQSSITADETQNTLDMLNEEALIENLAEMGANPEEGWLTRTLSKPKVVTGIIGLCLLASTVYAGIGYWWLNATSISHAAEPNRATEEILQPRGTQSLLNNIEALQNDPHIIIPNEHEEINETLLAQAGPAKTFTMAELKTDLSGAAGRPDPFSPLIQDGPAGFSPLPDPNKKKDVLLDVQYTGFIGDMNSKDKVAIIRVMDPAGGTKTLIKKAGDSFYVDGERIMLNAISKNSLSLRVSGASRSLGLNPYQEISTATTGSGGNTTLANPAPGTGGTASTGNTPSAPPREVSSSSNPGVPRLQEP